MNYMILFIVLFIFVFFVLPAIISLVFSLPRSIRSTRLLGRITREARITGDLLVLPEEAMVELGVVRITCYPRKKERAVTLERNVSVETRHVGKLREIDLTEYCGAPFYVYGDILDRISIEAPGFIIRSGRYQGVVGLCLNNAVISARRLELGFEEDRNEIRGFVELSSSGLKASLSWIPKSLTGLRVVYDSKTGTYRYIPETSRGDVVSGVELQVCYKGPDTLSCIPIVEASTPGLVSSGVVSWNVSERIVFVDPYSISYRHLRRWLSSRGAKGGAGSLLMGYVPGRVLVNVVFKYGSRGSFSKSSSIKSFEL